MTVEVSSSGQWKPKANPWLIAAKAKGELVWLPTLFDKKERPPPIYAFAEDIDIT